MQVSAESAAAVAAACLTAAKKSGRAWINGCLAWCAWHDGAIVLIAGGGEQLLTALEDEAEVVLASSTGAAAVRLTARVTVIRPDDPAWLPAATLLSERRLNSGLPAELVATWAAESQLIALTPVRGWMP